MTISTEPPPKTGAEPTANIAERIAALIDDMTLEEKVAQLCCIRAREFLDSDGCFDETKAKMLLKHGIGACDPIRMPIAEVVAFRNNVQRIARENTRHGIPALFHEEGCHGVLAPEATSFPSPIGLASSWDADLIERVFAVVAAEMRSRGIHHALSPVIDTNFDPRWGRTDEMMGEDPHLNAKLGAAMVRGLQGNYPDCIPDGRVAATLKHFVGHGAPEGGVNRAPANLGTRQLRENHLSVFRDVIAESNPATVMPSYNEVDGIPSHANRWLLQDVLRREFGFEGLIVSDYYGVRELLKFHQVVGTDEEAALRAFSVGVDTDLPMGEHYSLLPKLAQGGKVNVDLIDEAVARVLRLKFMVGLFQNSEADAAEATLTAKLESSKSLAREAAQMSIVLLKNQDGILPLKKDRYRSIAVIGPHADDTRLGSYSGTPYYRVSVLDGIRDAAGSSSEVAHAKGCRLTTNEGDSTHAWEKVRMQQFPTPEENQSLLVEAVNLAKKSDLIILVLGDNELTCREAWAPDHIGDRTSLDLFGNQNELAEAIFAIGRPVVVYLMNGRPLAIPHIVEKANAVLEGWYMGQETGNAAADIIFGSANPSGKLTMTIPRSVGQVPIYYNQRRSARGFGYMDSDTSPLFPFGFGLSYTNFTYSAPELLSATIGITETTEVKVSISNTGSREGDEIVQLYVGDKISSVSRPAKELKGFQRISLSAGESKTVSFRITPEILSFYNEDLQRIVEAGEFEITVGTSSIEGKSVNLVVIDRSAPI